jgi:hypothetical protein
MRHIAFVVLMGMAVGPLILVVVSLDSGKVAVAGYLGVLVSAHITRQYRRGGRS